MTKVESNVEKKKVGYATLPNGTVETFEFQGMYNFYFVSACILSKVTEDAK